MFVFEGNVAEARGFIFFFNEINGVLHTPIPVSFFVGIRRNRYIENFDSFMVANRNVGLALGVVTMLGTELGLITVMYNAQTGARDLFSSFHFIQLLPGLSFSLLPTLHCFHWI